MREPEAAVEALAAFLGVVADSDDHQLLLDWIRRQTKREEKHEEKKDYLAWPLPEGAFLSFEKKTTKSFSSPEQRIICLFQVGIA